MRRYAILGAAAAAIALFTPAPARAADQQPVRVFLDVSYAPDAGDFALKTSPLVLE